jgi:hypothetical protein
MKIKIVGWEQRKGTIIMGRLIDFKNRRTGLAEGEVYPPEVQKLEDKIDQEMEKMKERVLEHGINSVTDKDIRKVDRMTFRLSLLYEVYDIAFEDDDGA